MKICALKGVWRERNNTETERERRKAARITNGVRFVLGSVGSETFGKKTRENDALASREQVERE